MTAMVRAPTPRSLALGGLLLALAACQTQHHVGKEVPERPAVTGAAHGPRPLPKGTFEGAQGSLLDTYVARTERPAGPKDPNDKTEYTPSEAELRMYTLPANAKKMVTTLLTFAAQDNLPRARQLFSQQARWGVPDRREMEARPVLADGGQQFFDVFRSVAARFGGNENLQCPPIMPAANIYVRNGAEPMWCFYMSNDNLDILAFKLIQEGGSAKFDFVGLHEERPTGMIQRPGPLPPPMTPMVRRVSRVPPGFERGAAEGQPLNPDGSMPGMPPAGAQPAGPGDATPAGTQPAGTQPGTQPVGTQPAGTQPTGAQPGTQPAGKQPAGSPAQPGPTKAPTRAPAKAPTKAPTEAPAKAPTEAPATPSP
jgi:hypothetical protein